MAKQDLDYKAKVAELEATVAALQATAARQFDVHEAKVASLEEKVASLEGKAAWQDWDHRKKVAALVQAHARELANSADGECATTRVTLTISDVSEKKKRDRFYTSGPFDLTLDCGPISFKLAVTLHGGALGLYIDHDNSRNAATTRFPIVLTGSTITLTHPNGLLADETNELEEGSDHDADKIFRPGCGTGFNDFSPDWESYIVDNKLHVKATVCVRKWGSYGLPEI
jgi:exonuclease VII small subunit